MICVETKEKRTANLWFLHTLSLTHTCQNSKPERKLKAFNSSFIIFYSFITWATIWFFSTLFLLLNFKSNQEIPLVSSEFYLGSGLLCKNRDLRFCELSHILLFLLLCWICEFSNLKNSIIVFWYRIILEICPFFQSRNGFYWNFVSWETWTSGNFFLFH